MAGTVAALVNWVDQLPRSKRREPASLGVLQVAEELCARLSAQDAAPLLKQLDSLRVPVFFIRAVPEEMRFDTTRIVVESGRQIQIFLENPDAMPHNLVVVRPGARERVGTAAMLMSPDQVDANGRAYVPQSTDVIAGTKLLETGQSEMIRVIPPAIEGVYEFVCTFPGHWSVMWGEMVVTRDPRAYLEQRSEPPPAAAPTPVGAAHHHGN